MAAGTILVIGAGGQIGQLLIERLTAQGKNVVAMLRSAAKLPEALRAKVTVREVDLEMDFSPVFNGIDTVIFTAGSGAATGFDKTLLIDLWAAKRAVDYAKVAGVKHFVMVSSRGADNPDKGPERIKPYLVAKHFADDYLINSDVPYTILQPGRLTDEAASGRITTERPEDPAAQFITREDTADAIVLCVEEPRAIGKVVELFKGESAIETLWGLVD